MAAPKVGSRGRVVALDLLPILPISKNVTILQGDFLSPSIQEELAAVIAGSTTLRSEQPISQRDAHFSEDTRTSLEPSLQRVDSILSDMMANMSGIRARDIEASLELCETALRFARGRLKTGLTKSHAEDGEGKKVLALRDYKGNMLYVLLLGSLDNSNSKSRTGSLPQNEVLSASAAGRLQENPVGTRIREGCSGEAKGIPKW